MGIKNIMKLGISSMVASSMLYGNSSSTKLDMLTVTANKIEENIQDVPQSITVIDGEYIKEKGIKNVANIIDEIPNMTAIPDYGKGVNFRGLNSSVFTTNNPVVIYIDGIPTSDKYSFEASMANVQRVEVLRGPQGTLYGKDAIGAVINIVTKEPTNELSGIVGFEYGSNNYIKTLFNLTTPIIDDKLYFGLNSQIEKDDSWITNDYNNDDKASKTKDRKFSANLLYKVNDKLSIKGVISKDKLENRWIKGYGIGRQNNPKIEDFNRDSAEHVKFDTPVFEKSTIDSQSLSLKYNFDSFSLNSVTTHKKTDLQANYDPDDSIGNNYKGLIQYNYSDFDAYSQEIRLSSTKNTGFSWIGGLYFDKEKRDQGPYGMEYPNYDRQTYAFIGNYMYGTDSKVDSQTQALFGQTMIPINEKLELTLGARYQKIKKELDSGTYNIPKGSTKTPYLSLKDEKTWNTFLPKIALRYKINETLNPYVSISKGYMPGGYSYFPTSGTAQTNTFKPQQSINYEMGIKGIMDDFIYSASIFRMNIKDIHVYRSDNQLLATPYNAKKAHSQGLEFDFTYFPTDTLELSGAFGFIEAKYDDYDEGTKKFDGKKIENTPSHTINLGLAYYDPNGYYGRIDIHNQGDMNVYSTSNKEFYKVKGRTISNIKIGYKFLDWDIYGYVKNLTDEKYIDAFYSRSNSSSVVFGDPRFFGMGVSYKF